MSKLLTVAGFSALLTLLRMGTGFLISKVVAIYTGPAGLAVLGQVQSLVGILNGVVVAPVSSGVVRYTAENSPNGYAACGPWWRSALEWSTGLLCIAFSIGVCSSKYLSKLLFEQPDYGWVFVAACCVLPFSVGGTLVKSVLNGLQHYKKLVALGMLSVVCSAAVMIVLVIQSNLEGALLAAAINSGVVGLVMILGGVRQHWFKFRYFCGRVSGEQRTALGRYVLMALTSAITVPASLILVRNNLAGEAGWESVGYWQATWKISEVYLSVVTMALSTYYLPRLSTLNGVDNIKREVNKTALIVMPIVTLMALTVYLLRDVVILVLFTKEFGAARDLFGVQLAGDVVKITAWLYAFPMISRGAAKWFVSSEVFFAFSFFALSFWAVDIYGVRGVPIAYFINYIFYLIFVYTNFDKFAR